MQEALGLAAFENFAGIRSGGDGLPLRAVVDVTLREKAPVPGAPAVVADGALRDSIEPARQVVSIEFGKLTPHDQEDFLREVVEVGIESAESSDPSRDIME